MRARPRRGHTLAELACVTAVLAVLLTALFFVLAGARRTGARVDHRAAAVQAAQVLLARLAADLDSAAPGALALLDAGELAIGERVTYRFDFATGFVRRNGEVVRCGPFARVSFALAGPSVTVTTGELSTRITCPHLAPSRLDAYDPDRTVEKPFDRPAPSV